jgi:hypothetical protein
VRRLKIEKTGDCRSHGEEGGCTQAGGMRANMTERFGFWKSDSGIGATIIDKEGGQQILSALF